MKRVFVAIDTSDEARRRVASRISALKTAFPGSPIKWIDPEKLHLTIRFVGPVDEEQLKAVADAVERVSAHFRRFVLSLKGVGVFPSPSKARVLWIGIEDEQLICVRFREMLEEELRRFGFAGDPKALTPHLTVARIKDPRVAGSLVQTHLDTEFDPVKFEVFEIVIYESKLLPTGSVYSRIAGFQLRSSV